MCACERASVSVCGYSSDDICKYLKGKHDNNNNKTTIITNKIHRQLPSFP